MAKNMVLRALLYKAKSPVTRYLQDREKTRLGTIRATEEIPEVEDMVIRDGPSNCRACRTIVAATAQTRESTHEPGRRRKSGSHVRGCNGTERTDSDAKPCSTPPAVAPLPFQASGGMPPPPLYG